MKEDEVWVKIPNYNLYEVSSYGNVRSWKRDCIIKNEPLLLNPCVIVGYLCVCLYNNKKGHVIPIHKIMGWAFFNHFKVKGFCIDHIDEDKFNNNIENLRVISHRLNVSRSAKRQSGYVGAYKLRSGRYESKIRINGNHKRLGVYNTALEASQAYLKEAERIENGH